MKLPQRWHRKVHHPWSAHSGHEPKFTEEALHRPFVTVGNMSTSNAFFFDVLSDLVCASEHGSTSSQIVGLGLSNLHHPLPEPDVMPFYMLSTGTPFPSISTCPDSSVAPSPKSNEDSRTVPFSPTEGLDTQRSIPWIIVSFAEGPPAEKPKSPRHAPTHNTHWDMVCPAEMPEGQA